MNRPPSASTPPFSGKPTRRRVHPLLIVVLALCIGLAVIAWQRRSILDYISLYNYQPSSTISGLATDTTMTPYARRIFYVNHPAIQDRSSFNSSCKSFGEQTIVLGCYHPEQAGIFVFSVGDSRLQGVKQVTAAHEMLHAAYGRLSTSQRTKVDAMLEDYYQHDLHDPRILQTITSYKKTEPHDVVNEMHSVFGTEASNLPAPLEAYYQRYFTHRAKVVAYANNYQAEFTSRENQVATDDQQLQAQKVQIDTNEQNLAAQRTALQDQLVQMNDERTNGDADAYNAQVPQYNSQVDGYNQLASQTTALITGYNNLVSDRNALALQVNQLSQAISSHPSALSTQSN